MAGVPGGDRTCSDSAHRASPALTLGLLCWDSRFMQRHSATKALPLVLLFLSPACSRLHPPPSALDRLKPCSSSEGPTDAYCGKVDVWENRAAQSGRKLSLKVIVLPGLRREPAPDPIFYFAGGPGGGAAKMARMIREPFRSLQTDRDIVLVDQRGTGDSNPLTCKFDEDKPDQDPDAGIEKLRACLATYPAKAD